MSGSDHKSSTSLQDESGIAAVLELESFPAGGRTLIPIDAEKEKKLVRKLDSILLPMFTLLYMLNFIDRVAVGNAKIAGLEADLGMKGYDYNIMLTIFYLCFIVSEVPCNLALKHYGSWFLGVMTFCFGIATLGSAFVTTKGELIATRVFLGLAEGGAVPGLTYIMSRYYNRKELSFRIGIFFGCAPLLAGAFGGLLASGILSLPDIGSVTRWRKIFLVEGLITTGFGMLAIFFIPGDPQKTRMLNEEERTMTLARIANDQPATGGKVEATSWQLIKRSFNFTTLLSAAGYFFLNVSFQGLNLFLPTVIAGLGKFTPVQSQLRTVPPYCASLVWTFFISYGALRLRVRSYFLMLTVPLIAIGYIINLSTENTKARYAAAFLTLIGLGPPGPLFLAWGTDNASPATIRAMATALIPGIGNLGAVIAVWTYLPGDAPNYPNGNSLNVATSVFVWFLALAGLIYCKRENAKRERGERRERLEGKTEQEISELGYLHPDFRYQI